MKVFSVVIVCFTAGLCGAQPLSAQGSVSVSPSVAIPAPSSMLRPALTNGHQAITAAISSGRDRFQAMMPNVLQVATNGIETGRNVLNTIHSAKTTGVQQGVSALNDALGQAAVSAGSVPMIGGVVSSKLAATSGMVNNGGQAILQGLASVNQAGNRVFDMAEDAVKSGVNSATVMGNSAFNGLQQIADQKYLAATQGVEALDGFAGKGTAALNNAISTASNGAGAAITGGMQAAGMAMNAGRQAAGMAMNAGTQAAGAGTQALSAAMNAGAGAAGIMQASGLSGSANTPVVSGRVSATSGR